MSGNANDEPLAKIALWHVTHFVCITANTKEF